MLEEPTIDCTDCVECTEKIPFFNLLDKKELEIINDNRYSVKFKPGELILKQGLPSTHVISLVSGTAKIYVEGFHNRNLLFKLIRAWQLIDDSGLLTHGINQFSVSALSNVQVCFINGENFRKVIENNSRFACEVLRHRNQHIRYFFNRLVSLTQKHMLGRMADGLLYLSHDFYQADRFELSLSRQDMADLTAMSKDSAIRILKELEKDGIIQVNGRSLSIRKMEELERISVRG